MPNYKQALDKQAFVFTAGALGALALKVGMGAWAAHGVYSGGKDIATGAGKLMRGEEGGLGDMASGAFTAGISMMPTYGLGKGIKSLGALGRVSGIAGGGSLARKAMGATKTINAIGKPIEHAVQGLGSAVLKPLSYATKWKPGALAKDMAGTMAGGIALTTGADVVETGARSLTGTLPPPQMPQGITPSMQPFGQQQPFKYTPNLNMSAFPMAGTQ